MKKINLDIAKKNNNKRKIEYNYGEKAVKKDGRTRQTLTLKNQNNKYLTKSQIKKQLKYLEQLKEKYENENKNVRYTVTAKLINNNYYNIKSYDVDNIDQDIEEYLDGRVKDTAKFQNISQLYIVADIFT